MTDQAQSDDVLTSATVLTVSLSKALRGYPNLDIVVAFLAILREIIDRAPGDDAESYRHLIVEAICDGAHRQ